MKVQHLCIFIALALSPLLAVADKRACNMLCEPEESKIQASCGKYTDNEPKPKVHDTCVKSYLKSFKTICRKSCDSALRSKDLPGEEDQSKISKKICKRFKRMLPKPEIYEVCSKGVDEAISDFNKIRDSAAFIDASKPRQKRPEGKEFETEKHSERKAGKPLDDELKVATEKMKEAKQQAEEKRAHARQARNDAAENAGGSPASEKTENAGSDSQPGQNTADTTAEKTERNPPV